MLTCTRLRTALVASGLFLIVGFVLGLLAEVTAFAVPLSHLALLVVLAAVAILAVTFLASLLPGTSDRLKKCMH